MAQDYTTLRKRTGQPQGFRGSESGKDAKYAEIAAAKEREDFDTEMGWSGIGGASKKPRGAEYEQRFTAWKEKRKPKPKATLSSSEAAEALAKRAP